jgi:hypothetical protein
MNVAQTYFVPAFARYSSVSAAYQEGVVVLHRDVGHTDNCLVFVASEDNICTSYIDAFSYCSRNNADDIIVLDM